MTRHEKGQVLTANRLRDGDVVFLTRAGDWSETSTRPRSPLEPQAAKALEARGKDDERANLVTGVYLFDAERARRPCPRPSYPRAHPHPRPDGEAPISASRPKAMGGAFPRRPARRLIHVSL